VSTWTALEGSVRGAAHEQTQLPNQDSVATRVLDGGRVVIAALADGHGGERYVRSDAGSRLAVEAACDVLVAWLSDMTASGFNRRRTAALGQELRNEIVPAMVDEWRRRVSADLASRPFTDEEQSRTTASLEADPVIAYGATLLVAVVADRVIALAQLGDGDILVMQRADVLLPIEPDARLVASQTTSLCLETATDDFRCAVLADVEGVELVLLSSDGYANSFADDDWERTVGRDLAQRVHEMGVSGVQRELPDWLAASAAASGDDTSVVMIVADEVSAPDDAAVGSVGSRVSVGVSRRRLLLFAGIALAVGIAGGWLWGHTGAARSRAPVTYAGSGGSSRPAVTRATIVAGPGVEVAFRANADDPRPTLVAPTSLAAVTRVSIGTATWEVTPDGNLSVTIPPAGPVDVSTGIRVSAITVAGPALWAVDAQATVIVPIDVATRTAGTPTRVTSDARIAPAVTTPRSSAIQNAHSDENGA
jgi:hypothetical protein